MLLESTHETLEFFSVALAMIKIASTSFAADYSYWVANGYRWSAVNLSHAYIKKEDAKDECLHVSHKPVSEVIGRGYYLRRGKVVLVVRRK